MPGFSTRRSLKVWERRLDYRRERRAYWKRRGDKDKVAKWDRLVRHAAYKVSLRRRQLVPLGARALGHAEDLIGVMEVGGNNAGPAVAKIIRGAGGSPKDHPPWCGYFAAYCYTLAGSKLVDWRWAAVRLLPAVPGLKRVTRPRRGDLVRFTFSHVGLFVKDNGDGTIETIEGNTGQTGAVSDSKTGGDGVYRKVRAKSLVQDYLRVSR